MVTDFRPATNAKPDDNRFSILVADDDRGTRETLRDVLEDRGFSTVLAGSGEEAVEVVQVELVHLVLCDMHMPRMTGLEALGVIRQVRQLLPAILMTADATQDLLRQAFLAQVYSVIPKPVNKSIVLHTLGRALDRVYGPPPPDAPPTSPRT